MTSVHGGLLRQAASVCIGSLTNRMRATPELAALLNAAEYITHKEDKGHHPEAVGGWDYYLTRFSIGNRLFEGIVNIELTAKGMLLYDVADIKDITDDIYGSGVEKTRTAFDGDISINSLSNAEDKSNLSTKNSQSGEVKRSTSDIRVPGGREIAKTTNPLHIGQKAVRKVAMKSGKHGQLGVGVLYELPYQLANPMAITGNTTKHVKGRGSQRYCVDRLENRERRQRHYPNSHRYQ